MCGIFCLTIDKGSSVDFDRVRRTLAGLLKLAERRGREASGLAVLLPSGCHIVKQPTSASQLIRSDAYQRLLDLIQAALPQNGSLVDEAIAFLGHARLVTNGKRAIHENNQPFHTDQFVGVHNGIIVNADEIFAQLRPNEPPPELDSLSIAYALLHELDRGTGIEAANQRVLTELEGIASYLIFDTAQATVLAGTNNGSLHLGRITDVGRVLVSERQMLFDLNSVAGALKADPASFEHLEAGTVSCWRLPESSAKPATDAPSPPKVSPDQRCPAVVDLSTTRNPADAQLRRCSRCLLPHTMPFISFDDEGVCNWCRNNQIASVLPMVELEQKLSSIRSNTGSDCLIAVSGGRDSCYGLHVAKKMLGLNPVAFTYDWGMVTDIARRNTSRMCSKLGIEHILVSADIDKKRDNVRKNVEAWLKRPNLGTVPLFTAGDKQFYYHANRLKRELGVDAVVFCENGRFEKTWFKAGFCGIDEGSRRLWDISLAEKLKLAAYYGQAFARNPAFINSSLVDTFSAYISSYFREHDYIQLFNYIEWKEEEVESVLLNEYGWETLPTTPTTWRIGDGTAPFYNYIYYTAAGFTEFDTFRSNQIRAGHIDRSTAMERVKIENQPRFDAIREYTNLIGVNFDKAIRTIQAMPRLYS